MNTRYAVPPEEDLNPVCRACEVGEHDYCMDFLCLCDVCADRRDSNRSSDGGTYRGFIDGQFKKAFGVKPKEKDNG